MTWNVFVHNPRLVMAVFPWGERRDGSEWVGTVNAHAESEARAIAIIKFHIRGDADFDVSPR